MVEENEVYGIVGEDGFRKLVAEFYRQVPTDEVLGPMYPPDDLKGAEDRLGGFLIFRFGGPQSYITERGHPRLRVRHAPFRVSHEARDHWLAAMNAALDTADLPDKAVEVLRPFFDNTATFLINTLD